MRWPLSRAPPGCEATGARGAGASSYPAEPARCRARPRDPVVQRPDRRGGIDPARAWERSGDRHASTLKGRGCGLWRACEPSAQRLPSRHQLRRREAAVRWQAFFTIPRVNRSGATLAAYSPSFSTTTSPSLVSAGRSRRPSDPRRRGRAPLRLAAPAAARPSTPGLTPGPGAGAARARSSGW